MKWLQKKKKKKKNNNNNIRIHQLNGHELWRPAVLAAVLAALSPPTPVVALWACGFAF